MSVWHEKGAKNKNKNTKIDKNSQDGICESQTIDGWSQNSQGHVVGRAVDGKPHDKHLEIRGRRHQRLPLVFLNALNTTHLEPRNAVKAPAPLGKDRLVQVLDRGWLLVRESRLGRQVTIFFVHGECLREGKRQRQERRRVMGKRCGMRVR